MTDRYFFIEMVREALDLDSDAAISLDGSLRDLADSLSLLVLFYRLEDLGVQVDEDLFDRVHTVGDMWSLVQLVNGEDR